MHMVYYQVIRKRNQNEVKTMNKMNIYYNGKIDEVIWCSNSENWKEEGEKQAFKRGFVGVGYSYEFVE